MSDPRFIVIAPNDPRIPEDERYDPHEWRNVLFDTENERYVRKTPDLARAKRAREALAAERLALATKEPDDG